MLQGFIAGTSSSIDNYLKVSEKPIGLLMNFGSPKLEYILLPAESWKDYILLLLESENFYYIIRHFSLVLKAHK